MLIVWTRLNIRDAKRENNDATTEKKVARLALDGRRLRAHTHKCLLIWSWFITQAQVEVETLKCN